MADVLPGIRARRKAAGLTLTELAEKIGVTQQAVGMWERGETLPTAGRLPALAAALGCSIEDLYGEDPGGASPSPTDNYTQEAGE